MFELKELRATKENVLRAEAIDKLMEALDEMIQRAERQVEEDKETNAQRYAEVKEKYPDTSEAELSDYCWEYHYWCENVGNVKVLKNLKSEFVKVFVK